MANFWEARQAVLEGKNVKRHGDFTFVFIPSDFLQKTWTEADMKMEWEIVEEPKTFKRWINVYLMGGFEWVTHFSKESADAAAYADRGSCIELIVDEHGKFISGRNV